jgi:hypothetical protein
MNLYLIPPELRRRWCLVPGITPNQVETLHGQQPSGVFTKPDVVAEMAACDIHDLADLTLRLPEEVFSLPGVKLTMLLNLQAEILERLDTGPLVRNLNEIEITTLSAIKIRGANLPSGVGIRAKSLGLDVLSTLAATSPVTLLTQNLPLWKVRACRDAITAHLDRPSDADLVRAYAKRPLPPGLTETKVEGSRLMLSWVGYVLLKERCTTIGKMMKSQPTKAELDGWEDWEFRAKEFHVALAARRVIATIPDGDVLYRVPYQDGIPPKRSLLFGHHTTDEAAFLDQARCNPRDDLSSAQELAYENAPYDPDHHEAPEWIGAAWSYGMDALGFIADADLPYLFEAAGGRKETVCDMLIAVRRALLDRAQPGSGEAAYGPEHAYLRFFRTFPKAA